MSVSRTKTSRGWEVKIEGGAMYFPTRDEARAFARSQNPVIRPTAKARVKTGTPAKVVPPAKSFDSIVNDTVNELLRLGASKKQILAAFGSIRG